MGTTLHGYWGGYKTVPLASLVVSGANTVTLAFGQPVDVKRLIFVTTTAITVANAKLTVGVRKRDDTGSSNHSAFTMPFSGSAKNDVMHANVSTPSGVVTVAVDGLNVNKADPQVLEIDVDEELFITSDGGATAGAVDVFAQVQEQGWQDAYRTNSSVELAWVAP